MSNVEEKIKAIIVDKLKVDAADVSPEKDIVRDLGADSLDQVELVMELEEEFGVDEIPEEEAAQLKTVGDVINYVKEKAGNG
ncbi:MAG: acyl carrier protein [Candidatus Omnitrophica bacterium]|nr:acyl carrier protein [Candidatus Omnitrophota bacterium]